MASFDVEGEKATRVPVALSGAVFMETGSMGSSAKFCLESVAQKLEATAASLEAAAFGDASVLALAGRLRGHVSLMRVNGPPCACGAPCSPDCPLAGRGCLEVVRADERETSVSHRRKEPLSGRFWHQPS